MQRQLFGMVLLALACSSSNAALLSRAGGQAYYDTDTNLTWVADAKLARTSGYDADGLMDRPLALAWIASLNAQDAGQGYLGINDWRLPTVTDTGTLGCNASFSGTDCGWNVDLSTGEMARMFYGTLGNIGSNATNGAQTSCWGFPNSCLANAGPFSNLKLSESQILSRQSNIYWSGSGFTGSAWYFDFKSGIQDINSTTASYYAWAVRPGDIAVVPAPATVWLLGTALTLLGAKRRLGSRRTNALVRRV